MTSRAAFRGQPLLLLAGVLAGWLALRVALWQSPFEAVLTAARPASPVMVAAGTPVSSVQDGSAAAIRQARLDPPAGGARSRPALWHLWKVPPGPAPTPFHDEPAPAAAPTHTVERPRVAIEHSVLLALGLSRMQLPQAFAAYLPAAEPAPAGVAAGTAVAAAPAAAPAMASAFVSRWSADGWLLLRRDGDRAPPGPILSARPGYGRSQTGAVIRYSLAPASPLRPQAYLRVAAALAGPREREAAAGLSLRPLLAVPLRFAAEARASESKAGTRVRPAAYVVTEFPPLDLPLRLRGEAYLQGGYAGGEFATAFVDGQARVERPLARLGETELLGGAGVWGGAQKGAARLDIGPTAAVSFRLGRARGRLAADYRFRVAGDAEPASGPALTVSAGF